MSIYYIVAVAAVLIPAFVYIVRKVDKVTRLERDLDAAFTKIDKGFDDTKYFSSLLLEGMQMMIDADPALRDSEQVRQFRKKLTEQTITVARRV